MANNEQRQPWPKEKSKTADEAWEATAKAWYKVDKDLSDALKSWPMAVRVGSTIEGAVEATAREIAREEVEPLRRAYQELRARLGGAGCLDCGKHTGAVEHSFCLDCDMTRARKAQELAAQKGEQGPPAPSEGEEDAGVLEDPDQESTRPELDRVISMVKGWLREHTARHPHEVELIPVGDVRHLYETVQRLQRERDRSATDSRRMQQLWTEALDAIRERDAEIARLQRENKKLKQSIGELCDPRNWEVVTAEPKQVVVEHMLETPLTVRYVGPPESEGESDG